MKDTYILGISAFYHDSAAVLLKNGKIVAAVQEERFTRKKHDANFPKNAINYCLKFINSKTEDYNKFVGFYEIPSLKENRIKSVVPNNFSTYAYVRYMWERKKEKLQEELNKVANGVVFYYPHHLSHAASAFYPSPFKEAAILTIDGVGEWNTTTLGVGKNNEIRLVNEINFPDSLGLFYSAFTYFVGFKVNFGEYKLMGLAPYGKPKYVNLIKDNLIHINDDGSFQLNMDYFGYVNSLKMTTQKLHDLFEMEPRTINEKITQKIMDIAASVQQVTEEVMLKIVNYVYEKTKMDNLCMAGGVALNCVANGRVLKESKFKNVWIQPAAGDAGGALGVAYLIWYEHLLNKRENPNDAMAGAFLGPSYRNDEIQDVLNKYNAVYKNMTLEEIYNITSKAIIDGKIIGWYQGRTEYGPRALGNRSILANATLPETQKKLNLKIKYRESFRPFACSILREDLDKYFDTDYNSNYMLLVYHVKESRRNKVNDENLFGIDKLNVQRSDVPAITHINFSTRIHTVCREDNPIYYDMIKQYKKDSGCSLIVNTSFNVRGEPIVNTPEDAFKCFMNTEMDMLVLSNYILNKGDQKGVKVEKQNFEAD